MLAHLRLARTRTNARLLLSHLSTCSHNSKVCDDLVFSFSFFVDLHVYFIDVFIFFKSVFGSLFLTALDFKASDCTRRGLEE